MRRLLATAVLLPMLSVRVLAAEINVSDILTGAGDARTDSYFNMIFGPLWPGPNKTTLISALITNFNVLFFAIGAMLFVYNIVVAVTETAHDGEILGRRHSALWIPLRTVLAAAALVPMPTGYNAAQHAMAYVVDAGTSAATFFWDDAVDLVVTRKLPVVGGYYSSLDANFIQGLWQMELCRAVYNEEVAKGGDGLQGISRKWYRRNGKVQLAYSLGSDVYGACGIITLPPETAAFDRLAKGTGNDYQRYVSAMQQAVTKAVDRYAPIADQLAQAISKRAATPPHRDLKADLNAWRTSFATVMAPYINSNQLQKAGQQAADTPDADQVTPVGSDTSVALAGSLKSGGWSQAGFYYQLISRLSADSSSVATALPTITPGDAIGDATNPTGRVRNAIASQYAASNWYLFSSANGDAKKFLEQIGATYNGAIEWWNESVARSGINAFINQRVAFADSTSNLTDWLPSPSFFTDVFDELNPLNTTQDPMIALVHLGTMVAMWVSASTLALSGLAAIPFVSGAITVFSNIFGLVISALACAGFFIAFILPMIPTVIWVMAIIGFFLIVCEAIFAAPLWAIAHLSMEGKGMGGPQARRGYMLLLSIGLTPVLMLFGLFLGMILFRIAGMLINGGLYYAITSAQTLTGDSPVTLMWLVGIFVVLVFIAVVYVEILLHSFSLIVEFPARVFRWFDELGHNIDSSAGERATLAGRSSAGGGGQPLIGGGSRLVRGTEDNQRQLRDERDQR